MCRQHARNKKSVSVIRYVYIICHIHVYVDKYRDFSSNHGTVYVHLVALCEEETCKTTLSLLPETKKRGREEVGF